ncbi:MAG TPA: TIGR03435 family protein [Candidatus Acidoferrales bacterium]|nr:TIGR03435 family protein [Candidatus Acidoferrales bacterium]
MKHKAFFSGIVAAGAMFLLVRFGTAHTVPTPRQDVQAQPSFEVALIKPNRTGSGSHHTDYDHGRFVAVNITTKSLILRAYGIAEYQISGAPDWVSSDFYDINAKMDDAAAEALAKLPPEQETAQYRLLFQRLLADRFHMKVAHETKELPIFALVVAKGGIKFSPTKLPPVSTAGTNSASNAGQPQRGTSTSGNGRDSVATVYGEKLMAWAEVLSRQPELEGRKAVDETGLTGEYDFTMKWSRQREADRQEKSADRSEGGAGVQPVDDSGPSLFAALQEQLGLKLEAKKGPVDTIVIVHIERPSGN